LQLVYCEHEAVGTGVFGTGVGTAVGAEVVGQEFCVHDQYGAVQPTNEPVTLPNSQTPLKLHHPQEATAHV
jgi:hypothetical protein